MGFVGWRIAVLAQMASGVPHGVDVSPHPGWYVTAALLATAGSAASCVAGIVRRRVIGPAWTWCELAGVYLLMLTMPLLVPREYRIGTWIAFQTGFAHGVLSIACAILIGARRRPEIAALNRNSTAPADPSPGNLPGLTEKAGYSTDSRLHRGCHRELSDDHRRTVICRRAHQQVPRQRSHRQRPAVTGRRSRFRAAHVRYGRECQPARAHAGSPRSTDPGLGA